MELVIIFFILMTLMFYSAATLLGDNRCLSLLGVRGLTQLLALKVPHLLYIK